MFKSRFHINILLAIAVLVTQVGTVLAAPAIKRRPAVKHGVGQRASTGWIVSCNYSHSLSDDPIVFPGRPGAAHLHDFFGARSTDRSSTAAFLPTGGTTCAMPADTSAYWMPALYKNGLHVQMWAGFRHGSSGTAETMFLRDSGHLFALPELLGWEKP